MKEILLVYVGERIFEDRFIVLYFVFAFIFIFKYNISMMR